MKGTHPKAVERQAEGDELDGNKLCEEFDPSVEISRESDRVDCSNRDEDLAKGDDELEDSADRAKMVDVEPALVSEEKSVSF